MEFRKAVAILLSLEPWLYGTSIHVAMIELWPKFVEMFLSINTIFVTIVDGNYKSFNLDIYIYNNASICLLR